MAFCKYHSDPTCEDCRSLNPEDRKKLEVAEEMKKSELKPKKNIYPSRTFISSKTFISLALILISVILGSVFILERFRKESSLERLISAGNFAYIHPNIIEENFPDVGTDLQEPKVYQFDKYVSSDYVIERMDKDGYRPANLRELLIWMKNWNGRDWVVALGQSCGLDGSRRVLYLCGWGGRRALDLRCLEVDWCAYYRFLAFRKSSPR